MAAAVFVSMGLTQLNIEYIPPEPAEPLTEYHLPPPPPPPESEPPPEEADVSIDFDLPISDGPADIALGFLDVDFGLSSKLLTQGDFNIDRSFAEYQAEGLESVEFYDYRDVTEKPETPRSKPPLNIPGKLIGGGKSAISFSIVCVVTKEGRAVNVAVIDTDYPEANSIVIRWIESMRFKPGRREGEAVNTAATFKFKYNPASAGDPFSL